jgi:hypothetical protein
MEVLYPTILLQALVTIILLLSNRKQGSEDYSLALLMACFYYTLALNIGY